MSSTCEYCNNVYTTRGISRHLKACKFKTIVNKVELKHIILNDDITKMVLSYLDITTLCDLQQITGDSYKLEFERRKFDITYSSFTSWGSLFMELYPYLCKECKLDKAIITDNQCYNCFINDKTTELDKPLTLCKSNAKSIFILDDHDLEVIDYQETRNPYYRNAPPMILFKYADVYKQTMFKYDNEFGLALAIMVKKKRAIKRANNVDIKVKELQDMLAKESNRCKKYFQNSKYTKKNILRYKELDILFRSRGITIRSDSSLCRTYIYDNDGDPNYITSILEEMNYLIKNCNYMNRRNGLYDYYEREELKMTIYNEYAAKARLNLLDPSKFPLLWRNRYEN